VVLHDLSVDEGGLGPGERNAENEAGSHILELDVAHDEATRARLQDIPAIPRRRRLLVELGVARWAYYEGADTALPVQPLSANVWGTPRQRYRQQQREEGIAEGYTATDFG
jgi:hypothetical protein